MNSLITVLITLVIAWNNPCASRAVPFQHIPLDQTSIITLESRRVISIEGDTFTYNLGTETISITANSFAAHLFIEDVRGGRCSATQIVRIIPFTHMPFNSHFKTAPAH